MKPSSTDPQARLDELESRLALQDQSLLELSDEVYRQQQHIERLEREVRRLAERLESVAAAAPPPSATDEVPPHY